MVSSFAYVCLDRKNISISGVLKVTINLVPFLTDLFGCGLQFGAIAHRFVSFLGSESLASPAVRTTVPSISPWRFSTTTPAQLDHQRRFQPMSRLK